MNYRIQILLFSMILFFGCQKSASHSVQSTNSNFKVEVLFTVDGITVYRFEDSGRDHYFCARGSQGICMSGHIQHCGKYHRRYVPEEIVTDEGK